MDDRDLRQRAIELYDRFTHEGADRRAFMADLTRLAGSAAAAQALVLSIAPSAAAAEVVAADDGRVRAEDVRWTSVGNRPMAGYLATPRTGGEAAPKLLVIHENRGLTPHIRDVARRMAVAGFQALAPDLLTPAGGTPADEDRAREMIGALDLAATVRDAQSGLEWMRRRAGGAKVGAVGFCWGGAMIYRLAVADGPMLDAGVSYYGPAPAVAEVARLRTPLLVHLAGLDTRVNGTAEPFAAAARDAGKPLTLHVYPGVNHAFNNDTSAERYDAAAARTAWDRTTTFLRQQLA
ncbi:carboxymethylenebutenolidase [Sphingomonas jejuensis]|uniref:Carboxymethylenebutenolidase n=1 Tax=Sphingomonas jejuensis TaxID=904715 RepID=A0ABX0XHY8_9SPHN|nr:dienelactone hydrolase family protein [Sphingomonas jejuensis]NJC32839.1 carboxymethylenebutenolidase [Sphingomonas jejuensis]